MISSSKLGRASRVRVEKYSIYSMVLLLSSMILSMLLPSANGFDITIPDPVIHFTLGAVAGGAGAVAAYPFDYIKSQMQTEYGKATYANGKDAFIDTVQRNPWDLYKGVGVQVVGIAPEKGIKLGVNDVLAASFYSNFGAFPLWGQIISGGVAGACQVIASSPLEVLKVGLQTSNMTFPQVWNAVGGVSGLFRGAEACIFRDVLFTAICFPLYSYWVEQGVPTFVAGAMSGVIASFAATPPDVIKTRILSQDEWSIQKKSPTVVNNAPMNLQPAMVGVGGTSNATVTFAAVSNSTIAAVSASKKSEFVQQDFYRNDGSVKEKDSRNPFVVAQQIVEREGASVLLSGVSERCLGAIPRFGTTMAMHDSLEQLVAHQGWLSQATH